MLKFCLLAALFSLAANIFAQTPPDNSVNAKSFIELLAKKDFATAEGYFNDAVKSKLSADKLAGGWASLIAQFGDFKTQGKTSIRKQGNLDIIVTTCEFEKGVLNITTTFDDQGKLAGLFFAPSGAAIKPALYETPTYANPALFEEKEVTVGSSEWALPATLTIPKGKSNVPALVLVHGSGPNDRDETIGGNKVFKDLAWGLASKGIAVLRYEKRTRQYGAKMVADKSLTINEETVDDALAAVSLLRQTPNVDAKKIFVLGHSLGGLMIPRIGQKDDKIAGLITFAGSARLLEDVFVEQNYYLASLNGMPSAQMSTQLEALKQLAEKTKNLKATDAPDTPTLMNLPVAYWISLNSYDLAQAIASIKQPMLILQGESDYQVTMKDFQIWKDALGTRKNVTFKTYPKLTHLFMETTGEKPSPKDYDKTSHVNAQVIDDITNWILKIAQ